MTKSKDFIRYENPKEADSWSWADDISDDLKNHFINTIHPVERDVFQQTKNIKYHSSITPIGTAF